MLSEWRHQYGHFDILIIFLGGLGVAVTIIVLKNKLDFTRIFNLISELNFGSNKILTPTLSFLFILISNFLAKKIISKERISINSFSKAEVSTSAF